jgi:glycosyltransferase involved in cell wall biosynthesis
VKVLHLCAGNLYGGVERIVAQCAASRLLDRSSEPSFAVCYDGRLAQQVRATGAACEVLGPVRASRPHTVVRARRTLSDLLDRQRPDVAITHSCWTHGLAAPVLARQGISAVPWIHDRLSGRTWVERWASRSTPPAVICNSRYTADSVASVFPGVPTHVVYAPVAGGSAMTVADRQHLRRSHGAADDTCVVLIASRFEAWKGHHDLIESLASLSAPWQLWVAGEAQKPGERAYDRALRELAAKHQVQDRVRFLGHSDDVPALMAAADLLCQPNTDPEPFGIAFVEALYAGLPVVTTKFGGAAEIVTDACGVLVPPGDRHALVQTLGALLSDPRRRHALGSAGPARAASLCDPSNRLAELSSVLAGAGVPCH